MLDKDRNRLRKSKAGAIMCPLCFGYETIETLSKRETDEDPECKQHPCVHKKDTTLFKDWT
jgi:hypothetical protein